MAKKYKAGQVAASLFSDKTSRNSNNTLIDLFSGTRLPSGDLQTSSVSSLIGVKRPSSGESDEIVAVRKKKKKNEDPSKSEEFPFQHESIKEKEKQDKELQNKKKKASLKRKKEDENAEKRPRRNRTRDKIADTRTIFVGNCPLSADKKVLKKLFNEYGEIETIRFRCAPAADPNLPRRAIMITRNFNEKCKSYIGYVVFKEEEAAKKACEKNGFVLDDLHLRVDIAAGSKKTDKKRSVFIGNLPFDIQEDKIRGHFSDCGDIVNVRIVRDRQTSLGKGISYVSFDSKDSVGLALKLNNSQLEGRRLRVMACTNKAKDKDNKKQKEKKKDSDKKHENKKDTDKKKISFAPSNASISNFKSILQNKKEKRMRKFKKKATGKKKTDSITAILGEAPPTPKQVKKLKRDGPKKGAGGSGFKKGPKNFKGKGGKNRITSRSQGFKKGKKFGRNKS